MTYDEVIDALTKVRSVVDANKPPDREYDRQKTKGGYYRVGNVAIKIAEITEVK